MLMAAIFLGVSGCNGGARGSDVVATVNGKKLLQSDLDRYYDQQLAGSQQKPEGAQADSLIVNINVRADIHAFPETLQTQFWAFVERCTTQVADLQDPNYFEVEVYQVLRPPPDLCS